MPRARRVAGALGALGGAAAGLGLFESQWVECRAVEVRLPGLPRELEGFRILHLSDSHLGSLSLNVRAFRRAVDWAAGRELDLVAITGDLLNRPRGERPLRHALGKLHPRHGTYVALGNHDVAITRDPLSGAHEIEDLLAEGAVILRDESATLEARGLRIQIVGSDPRAFMARRSHPERLADDGADLRVLLCHFPDVVDRLPAGAFHLVLAGHLHGGQICLPYPGGKIRFGDWNLRPRYPEGVFGTPGTTLVVSRGTGTAFVPFRFFARPEAAELVLRPGRKKV